MQATYRQHVCSIQVQYLDSMHASYMQHARCMHSTYNVRETSTRQVCIVTAAYMQRLCRAHIRHTSNTHASHMQHTWYPNRVWICSSQRACLHTCLKHTCARTKSGRSYHRAVPPLKPRPMPSGCKKKRPTCMHACMCACVHACVCACVRVYMRACMYACMCVCGRACASENGTRPAAVCPASQASIQPPPAAQTCSCLWNVPCLQRCLYTHVYTCV